VTPLPRAGDVPSFIFETRNVPCRSNPLTRWRGFGIRHLEMPATPERVWAAIQAREQAGRQP
jgi:carbon-monoxide dehydrogenase large subunit